MSRFWCGWCRTSGEDRAPAVAGARMLAEVTGSEYSAAVSERQIRTLLRILGESKSIVRGLQTGTS